MKSFCKDVNCTGPPAPAPNNTNPGGDHPDDNFDVSSRMIELYELDVTQQGWKDLYGRTGVKKGYSGLFLEKTLTGAYARLSSTSNEADFSQAAQQFGQLLDFAKNNAKYSFEDTYYASADVALLSDAFVDNAAEFLLKCLKEPIREVKETFNPAVLIKNQPVLLVPSGALSGYTNSTLLKSSLDEYVKQGGTLVVFAQQHGYDFSIIPTPDDKPLAAYGWTEDQSCFSDAVSIDTGHQMLSSQSRSTPSVSVDGYFTSYPANSTVLLRRTINGQPALLMYVHGAGRVIVTSMYSDWAYGHGQASGEEIALIRDILSWAKKPAQLPEIKPGDTVTLPVTVTNSTATDAASIKLQIWNPDRTALLSEQMPSLAVPAGQPAVTTVNWQSAANSPLGIYHVDYILMEAAGNVIQPQAETDSGRFIVSNPPTSLQKIPDFNFAVNSDSEQYPRGSDASFTISMYNNTDAEKTITARYFFPHHYWDTGETQYGGDWSRRDLNLTKTMTIPPRSSVNFAHVLKNARASYDRLWAYFYDETGKQVGDSSRGFYVFAPSVTLSAQTDKANYAKGDTVNLAFNLQNKQNAPSAVNLQVRVTDPMNLAVYTDSLPLNLAANGSTAQNLSFVLPTTTLLGSYTILAEAYDESNNKIGGNSAAFELSLSQIAVTPALPVALAAGVNTIPFNLVNAGKMAVSSGNLDVTLKDPDGLAVATLSRPFTLSVEQSSTIDIPVEIPALKFGAYSLSCTQSDETRIVKPVTVSIANCVQAEPVLDKTYYKVRDVANLSLNLSNGGRFNLENAVLSVKVTDMNYSEVRTIASPRSGSSSLAYAIPIPETAKPGQHNLSIVLALPSGSSITKTLDISIPESELTVGSLPASNLTAGDTARIPIRNTGGEDTTADYTIELYDLRYTKIAATTASAIISAGSAVFVELPIPVNATTGNYFFKTTSYNRKKNVTATDYKQITVQGTEAALKVTPSKEWYPATEIVKGTTAVTLKSGELANATLNVKVIAEYPDKSLNGLMWWDKKWKYRQPIVINAGSYDRENYPAAMDFNFTDEFAKSGKAGVLDEQSIRVIEYDTDGKAIREVPSQFDKADDYNVVTKAKGKVYWIVDGATPAGAARRYALYFDTQENGPKGSAGYEVVVATLDNTNKFFKTDGVYFKWGGIGYNTYADDIITDFKFDDNGNGDPSDDFDRLQDTDDWYPIAYGFLGNGFVYGFGGTVGTIAKQGPVFVEINIGKARFRYYKNNKQWLETNEIVSYLYNFSSIYDYVKAGNKAEKYLIDSTTGWENPAYYGSWIEPGYIAFRSSKKSIIFGAVDNNATYHQSANKLSSGYTRTLSFYYNPPTADSKIYWYSDTTGNYQKIGKFSDSILNPVNYLNSATEIQAEDISEPVVWESNTTVNVTGSMDIDTDINLQGRSSGKYYLQSTLISALNQLVSRDLHPFYMVNGNTLLISGTDKKIYKPNETVTLGGEVRNLGVAEARI